MSKWGRYLGRPQSSGKPWKLLCQHNNLLTTLSKRVMGRGKVVKLAGQFLG